MLTVLPLWNREYPVIKNINYKLRVTMIFTLNLIIMKSNLLIKSSQVTFIYIALCIIQIVSKQLHSDNMKIILHR